MSSPLAHAAPSVFEYGYTATDNLKQTLAGEERAQAEDLLCRVALEGLYRFAMQEKGDLQ